MALSLGPLLFEQVKGPFRGAPASAPLHIGRITIPILSGSTYATGGNQIDIATAMMQTQLTGVVASGSRMGFTSISVITVSAFGDYTDTLGLTATVNNASIVLTSGGALSPISSASTQNLAVVKLFTGVNGIGGAEIANATALGGSVGILFTFTGAVGALGNV